MSRPAGPIVTALPAAPSRWADLRHIATYLTTALLLIALGVGFMALRLRVSQAPDQGPWVPALVRALDAAPGVSDAPLVETTFAPADLPSGEKEAIYYQLTIPPGVSLPYPGAPFCGCRPETVASGVGVEFIQSGAYTLRLEAPLQVQRAAHPQSWGEIPAGVEVTLTAGDAVMYPDYAASGEIRNTGDEPVTLLGVAIVAAEGSGTPVPAASTGLVATMLYYVSPADWNALPPGPLNLALRQVTVPVETSIGPYQPVGIQALRITSGVITRGLLRAGDSAPSGPPLVQAAGSTIASARPGSGLREILVNTGVDPADLLVLLIEPTVSGVQSLGG
jgi:hypothetical protein